MESTKEEQAETLLRIEQLHNEIKDAQAKLSKGGLTKREANFLRLQIEGNSELIETLSIKSTPKSQLIMRKLLFESRKNTVLLRIITHPCLKAIRDEMLAADIDLQLIAQRRMSFKKYQDQFPVNDEQARLFQENDVFEEFITRNMSRFFRTVEKQQFVDDFCWAMSEDEDWEEEADFDKEYDPALDHVTFENCCLELDLNPVAVREQYKIVLEMGLDELIDYYNKYIKPDPTPKRKRKKSDS